MRGVVIAALVALALLPVVVLATVDMVDGSNIDAVFAEQDLKAQFDAFKRDHHKRYRSHAEERHRFSIFKQNMEMAAELQKKNPEATFGVNMYADLHPVEFRKTYLNFVPVRDDRMLKEALPASPIEPQTLPTEFDWRRPDQGRDVAVTAVKDQGQCGSCWAFSATEALESAWILAGNTPVALAPQQTVDCDTAGTDQGCNGGYPWDAYQYMKANGVEAEASYPYTSGETGSAGTCNYNASAVVATLKSFVYATPPCTASSCPNQNEATLQASVYATGPPSVCVDASSWQTYTGGILTAASGCGSSYDDIDHCVQLTGWGVQGTTKYWSVRNSWAASWGEQGYIRLLFGKNTCAIADAATQVTAG